MRRLLVALALAAIPIVPAAAGDVAGYSHPLNVGGKDPYGILPEVEEDEIRFRSIHPFTQFTVEARDHLGLNTWMRVCVRIAGHCQANAEGAERVVVNAPASIVWPSGTQVSVYVYSAHVWADGEVNVGTWGGIRARFGPDPQVDDIVPYAAAGYGGLLPLGIPVNVRLQCGYYLSAQCATIPFNASSVRVTLTDDVVESVYYELCATHANGAEIRCIPASGTATIVAPSPGGFPAGGEIDVRPYLSVQNKLMGTKGFAIIQYFP